MAVGAVLPEAIAAAEELDEAGIPCDAVCLTSPDLIFRALQASQGLGDGDDELLDELFPPTVSRRSSPSWTAIPTRSAFSRRSGR